MEVSFSNNFNLIRLIIIKLSFQAEMNMYESEEEIRKTFCISSLRAGSQRSHKTHNSSRLCLQDTMDDDDDDISSTTVNKILHSVVLFILEGVSESATIPREVIAASPSKRSN